MSERKRDISEIILDQPNLEILKYGKNSERIPVAIAQASNTDSHGLILHVISRNSNRAFVPGSAEKFIISFIESGYQFNVTSYCEVIDNEHLKVCTIKDFERIRLRQFFRVDAEMEYSVHECDLSWKPLRALDVDSGGHVDISGGGFLFYCRDLIQENTRLYLKLTLDKNSQVETKASVVRCIKQESRRGWFEIAVSFVEISEVEQDKILNFVSHLQRKQINKGVWLESK